MKIKRYVNPEEKKAKKTLGKTFLPQDIDTSILKVIKYEYEEIVKFIDKGMGKDYAFKNPGLVQHLLDKIQQQEDRTTREKIHLG